MATERQTELKRTDHLNKPYLAFVRGHQCLACERAGTQQMSRTEAHHAGPRPFGRKAPDSQAIPLCADHHRTGKYAVHVIGRRFWQHHGIDMKHEIERLNSEWRKQH